MKKVIIIIVILIALGGILFFLSSQRQSPATNIQQPAFNQAPPVTNQELILNQEITPSRELTEEEKLTLLKNELKLKARNFVERYGSFSTDVNFQNLKDLKNEMSVRLWQETENYIRQKERETIKEFYGITTKVLNVEEKSFSENQAEYLISTQREEVKDNQPARVFYQTLELKIIKEGEEWKVDRVVWQ
ncbi:MAG: hypothetical protein N2259_02935 [Patescibacteria group bacterium]|nr:hypothetical protein [Patescibacteria group bacterium]